jgi:hypothetical protein
MSMSTFAARTCLLGMLVCAAPRPTQAAPSPATTAADTAALSAERARLRGELDRVSAEIDALKRAHPSLGDEGRLRARMADAEALARRLIEIEARLGLRAPAAGPVPPPVAAPTDGPAELDAKADILTDQSRRVRQEADLLGHRVAELKGRQDLRRRAADLDRDPFAPLEGSKRRMATIATPDNGSHGTLLTPSSPSFNPPPGGMPVVSAGTPPKSTAAPMPISNSSSPPLSIGGGGSGTTTTTGTTSGASTMLTIELRDLLDPTTVADIRRLEGARTPTGSVAALERAVAALRARADALDAQARTLRASATQK